MCGCGPGIDELVDEVDTETRAMAEAQTGDERRVSEVKKGAPSTLGAGGGRYAWQGGRSRYKGETYEVEDGAGRAAASCTRSQIVSIITLSLLTEARAERPALRTPS